MVSDNDEGPLTRCVHRKAVYIMTGEGTRLDN